MNENILDIKQKLDSLINLKALPLFKSKIKVQREFIEKCKNLFLQLEQITKSDLLGNKSLLKDAIGINERIENLILPYFENDGYKNFQEVYPDFYNSLENFLSNTSETVVELQNEQRFINDVNDRFSVKLRKPFKKFFLSVSNIPVAAGNTFRKLFKKPLKDKKSWKRIVPLRKFRKYHFDFILSENLLALNRKLFAQRSIIAKTLWLLYESLDEGINQKLFPSEANTNKQIEIPNIALKIKELQTQLTQFEESLPTEIENLLNPIFTQYEDKYLKAGTIEYPQSRLRKSVLRKKEKEVQHKFETIHTGWKNNFTSLGDDWQMNNELYLIRYKTLDQLEKYKTRFQKDINSELLPLSEKIMLFVSEIRKGLKNSNENLSQLFNNIKRKINSELTLKLIPEINSALLNQNFSGLVAEFDNTVQESINKVKQKRFLVKTDDYDKEIKNSEINTFSPKEILEYSAAPKYFKTTGKLKTLINSQIQQIQIDLTEIDHISDFTIDSALNLLETENDNEASKTIAVDGIERAEKKLIEIKTNLENLSTTFNAELQSAVNTFCIELKNLTETEKIFDIRLNLAKAKALQRSKQIRKQVVENTKNVVPQFLLLFKKGIAKLKELYQQVRELFGLAPAAKAITSEVSDYLVETQSAIHKLPFVYQRLFAVSPLDDERFFFGREAELGELNKSLTNWQKEKFATTVIVGEKGSGSTSLINYFLANEAKNFEIIRTSIQKPFSDLESFFNLFSDIVKDKTFKSTEDIVEYLNGLPSKKIFVIENLQRLFLRKVDGFTVLKIFFEIISKTNKNIFWVTTCTIYSWSYIDKTIYAPDYFGYVIYLKKLDETQMTDLVSKRHRVSGYNIEYKADAAVLKSKAYKKLSEKEKQPYLMKKYFAELNRFAQSNISLAQIFWLRSAKTVVDDVIKIGSPPDLDYSFLANLTNDKVFALNALLMHDGLTEEDHSEILNVPVNKSRLLFLLMHDDGIIVKQNDLFIINPLLYRQIVGLLKSKNIIH